MIAGWSWIYVACGGAIGATLRYMLSLSLPFTGHFPWATWLANILGCFAIGIFFALTEKYPVLQQEWRLFIVVGILGGFTTFSSFSLEVFNMLKQQFFMWAGIYVVSSVLLGLVVLVLGYWIAKIL